MATEDDLREKITFGLRDAYEAKMEGQRLISEVRRAKEAPCEACGHKRGHPANWWEKLRAGYRRLMGSAAGVTIKGKEFVTEVTEQAKQGLIVWRKGESSYAEADWNGGKLFVGRGRLQDDITFEVKTVFSEDLGLAIRASLKAEEK